MSRAYPIEQDTEYQGPGERVADAQDAAASGRGWYCDCCGQPLRDLHRDFYQPSVVPSWWKDSEKAWSAAHCHEFLACDVCGRRFPKGEVERHFGQQYDPAKRTEALKQYYGEDYDEVMREGAA